LFGLIEIWKSVKDFTGLGLTFSDACSCFNPHGCRIYLYFYTKKGRFINKKAKNHLNFPTPSYSVLCFQLFLFSTVFVFNFSWAHTRSFWSPTFWSTLFRFRQGFFLKKSGPSAGQKGWQFWARTTIFFFYFV